MHAFTSRKSDGLKMKNVLQNDVFEGFLREIVIILRGITGTKGMRGTKGIQGNNGIQGNKGTMGTKRNKNIKVQSI